MSAKAGEAHYDQGVGQTEAGPDAHPPVEEILSVPLTGGPSSFVVDGHDPEVSPDGQLLAYETWTDITSGPEAVVVRNLSSGAVSTWQFATNVPDINSISWSPDSKSLAVASEVLVGSGPRSVWDVTVGRLVLSDPSRSLNDLPQIRLPRCPAPTVWASPGTTRDMAWAGYFAVDEGIGRCEHVGLTWKDNWTQPVIVNLATGDVVRRLPAVPGLIGVGPGGGFDIDPSGHHLVFIGEGLGAGGLYRWTVSAKPGHESRPVFIRNDVGAAGWVPPAGPS